MEELQFERAEPTRAADGNEQAISAAPAAPRSADPCQRCGRPLGGSYFGSASSVICASCAQAATSEAGAGRRLLRAFGFGLGAAGAGSLIWYLVTAWTGYELGILAIALGYAIGIAVRVGSEGRGGRGYQLLAVWLTYSAVVTTYVPQVVGYLQAPAAAAEASNDAGAEDPVEPGVAADSVADEPMPTVVATVIALPIAFVFPVLVLLEEPGSGIMGLIILAIALWEAWKLNTKQEEQPDGPHLTAT